MRRRKQYVPEAAPFVGDVITLRAGELVFGGAAKAQLEDGRIAFVSFAAPGELVEVEIEKVHPDFVEGVVRTVIEPSADRVEAACQYFGECGGCQLQHLSYEAQLQAKEGMVREQLRRIGHMDDAPVRPIVGAASPWAYRNHVRFSTGQQFGDLGFVRRHGRGLMKIDACPISSPWVNDALRRLQGHGAGLHQVQMRHSEDTGSFLINPKMEKVSIETGQKSYLEQLGGVNFQVSDSAFFQVNHEQATEMVRLVGEALPERGELLVDAFAGVATFAVLFASRFTRVIAIEEAASASKDSKFNIRDTPNVVLRRGKVEAMLPNLPAAPDAILLDPPRAGCMPEVIAAIAKFRPKVVAYVSCNPSTLARDLRLLVEAGYVLDWVTPLDMFPQTGHIESVSRLSLPGEAGE